MQVTCTKSFPSSFISASAACRIERSLEFGLLYQIDTKLYSHLNDTSALESEIDRIVYHLYGLTDEEVRIVEGKD